ncbi:hypothetical protein PGT21_000114 [Puccinia graminis f. sp. tritici]|uniref:Uncharacterized protein n=1 Tax=Puccinia graminis f. sp. tritici TaxID=56615 RepID=A0A5B0LJF8_PUCGR|nr:hypothetical protein PGT21_000114 [Puccinia graminis f. sp. tritici]
MNSALKGLSVHILISARPPTSNVLEFKLSLPLDFISWPRNPYKDSQTHQIGYHLGLTVSTRILRLRPGFRLVLDLGDALKEAPGSGNSLRAPRDLIRLVAWFGSLVLSLNNRLDYAGIDLGLNYFDLEVDQQSGGDVVIELK